MKTTKHEAVRSIVGQQFRSSLLLGLFIVCDCAGTTDLTSSSGSDETDFLTWWGSSGNGRGVTNVLLVTTTVGMVDGVHCNTSNLGPSVSLCSVLKVSRSSFEEGLVGSLTTGNNTNHTSAVSEDGLSHS